MQNKILLGIFSNKTKHESIFVQSKLIVNIIKIIFIQKYCLHVVLHHCTGIMPFNFEIINFQL